MPPVTPSAMSDMAATQSVFSFSRSIISTCFVSTSCCATVVFLCSPDSTRGVDPASSCLARAPAVTTNSNEFGSLERSIIKSPDNVFCLELHATQPGTFCNNDSPKSIDGGGQFVVHDDEVVLAESGHLVARDLQPPLDIRVAVLAATAQPLLQHAEGRRHHE